jgi:hypothetical protein
MGDVNAVFYLIFGKKGKPQAACLRFSDEQFSDDEYCMTGEIRHG